MTLLPAFAELAANAGTGPEGHKRSASVDSGASSDATMIACDINGIDGADVGAVDGCHKLVAIEEALTSPPECFLERAADSLDPVPHDAKRGRVSTDTASGAPALATTTNTAGSSTTAAPSTLSIHTATTLAVADPDVNALDEPDEASDAGQHEAAPARSTPAAAARDAAAPSIAGPDVVIPPAPPASASSAIVDLPIVDHHNHAPASAPTATGATSALGTAASESATIDANPTSHGDAGCPETPVVSRRSHAVAIRAFSIGRTSTPAPVPQASGSKSAVIVANATSRGAHCPPTPVVSRLPVPRSHTIEGATAVGNNGPVSALRIGLRCSAISAAAPPALAPATTPAVLPIPATAPSPFELARGRVRRMPIARARIGALHAVSRVIQRGMGALRNALVALFHDSDMESTERQRSTLDEGAHWDEGAPIDAALLGLRKRQRRHFL